MRRWSAPTTTPLERKYFLWRHLHKIALAMERTDKQTIASLNGAARGVGLDVSLCATFA